LARVEAVFFFRGLNNENLSISNTGRKKLFFDYEEEHEELLKALKKTFATTKEGSA